MKCILIVTFLSLLLHHVYGANTIDYIKYNNYINKAELAIVEESYTEAEQYYDSAFQWNPNPFGRDIQNAVIVLMKEGKGEQSLHYAQRLAALGVGSNFFRKKRAFATLKSSLQWGHLLRMADSTQQDIKRRNASLIKDLTGLDQSCKSAEKEYSLSDKSLNASVVFTGQIDSLSNVLLHIFNTNGYPSEHEIGLNIVEDTIIAEPIFTQILMLSPLQKGEGSLEVAYDERFLPVLRQAAILGKVSAEYVYKVISCEFSSQLNMPSLFRFDCKLYIAKSFFARGETIDSNRRKLGLSDHTEFEKKAAFNFQNPDNPFAILPQAPKYNSVLSGSEHPMDVIVRSTLIAKLNGCDR